MTKRVGGKLRWIGYSAILMLMCINEDGHSLAQTVIESADPEIGAIRTTSEVAPGIYHSEADTPEVIGKLDLGTGGIDHSAIFYNASHKFVGDITEFVLARSDDDSRKTISIVAADPEPAREARPLSSLGVLRLNEAGIVEGSLAKSGWINGFAVVRYRRPLAIDEINVILEGVYFWTNEGGRRVWDFRVGQAFQGSTEVPVKVVNSGEAGPRPVIVVDNRDRLAVTIRSLEALSVEYVGEETD